LLHLQKFIEIIFDWIDKLRDDKRLGKIEEEELKGYLPSNFFNSMKMFENLDITQYGYIQLKDTVLIESKRLISFIITWYLPSVRSIIQPYLGFGNMAALGVLIFILFGTAVGRLNLGYESTGELGKLLVLAFFQDFGVLFLARILAKKFFAAQDANALMVSLSMKNVAIAASILLFYDPRASIAPAAVFIAHAFLFSFLPSCRRFLVIREQDL